MITHNFSTQSARLKFILYHFDITQQELAKAIQVSQSAISQVMRGNTAMSIETIEKLSKTYNLDCNWLVLGEGEVFRKIVSPVWTDSTK